MIATLEREHPAPTPLVGRDAECARIQRLFLDRLSVGGRGLYLVGDAGIGKTALWQWTRCRVGDQGARFLHTRGYPDDQDRPYSALRDLLREEPAAWEALQESEDAEARGRALLAGLEDLARTQPVVIGLDDLQWIDEPSVVVVRHALSRLADSPVSLIATIRWSEHSAPRGTVLLPADRLDLMQVGPLDLESTGQAIRERLGHLSQPELHRVHELGRGNPSAVLGFVRHLRDCGLAWDEAVS